MKESESGGKGVPRECPTHEKNVELLEQLNRREEEEEASLLQLLIPFINTIETIFSNAIPGPNLFPSPSLSFNTSSAK